MNKSEKAKLIRTLRAHRLKDLEARRKNDHAMNRLQARLLRRGEKLHAPILRKATELLGVDPEALGKEHAKADAAIRKQLDLQKKTLAKASKVIDRENKRKLSFAKRTAKAIQTSSAALASAGEFTWDNTTCLWRADSDEQPPGSGTPTAETTSFTYGNSDGVNKIRFRLQAASYDPYGSDWGWRNYQLNFYYEQNETGVIGISAVVEPKGVATIWSSTSGGCGFNPASLAKGFVAAYIAASGIDANGNPQTWSPTSVDLVNLSMSSGGADQSAVYDMAELWYTNYLPVIGGAPLVISVGVEVNTTVWGIGESELEFFSPASRGVNFPYVAIRRY